MPIDLSQLIPAETSALVLQEIGGSELPPSHSSKFIGARQGINIQNIPVLSTFD